MANFLDVAEDLLHSGALRRSSTVDDFRRVFAARASLRSVHSKARLDLDNLENLFAVFESAALLGRCGTITDQSEVELLVPSMQRMIVATIENTVLFNNIRPLDAPTDYAALAVKLLDAVERSNREPAAPTIDILTFNYDVALDVALLAHHLGPDYCLGTPVPAVTSQALSIRVFKLHGSLNWFTTPDRAIHVNDLAGLVWTTDERLGPRRGTQSPLRVPAPHGATDAVPLIAPPTWNKREYYSSLAPVWRAAADSLARASNILVCGYSLPPSDHFFKHLYALGADSDQRLRCFRVLDPNADEVGQRFRDILGEAAASRFQTRKEKFDGLPRNLEEVLR